jgi:hypothetical protein
VEATADAATLEREADAAFWRGDVPRVMALQERAYRRYREGGDARGAGRMATALAWHHTTQASGLAVVEGWIARAHRLLDPLDHAASPVAALREARRVARPGALVAMATWGEPQDCEAAVYLKALGALMPPPPPGAGGPFALSAPGALEALVTEAGFEPGVRTDVDCPFAYPDLETALRGLLGAGPAEVAIRHSGEAAARAAVTEAITPFATTGGGYLMENRFRFLVARA